ncbi:MAG: ATP-dependent helicase [Ignisphaera sp.]|nr:ATP-dependent helicase [Ignisphaera sp.]
MNEVVSNYEQQIKFVIGFAGSGKSTELARLCIENDTLVLTPTHQAAKVLMAKGLRNVYTIHSVLKLVPTIDEDFRKGQKLQRLKQIGTTDLSHIKTIAIDEFSMINTRMLDMLLAVLPADCEVVVFGDASQLPPVDGEAIDPELYTDNIKKLTVQHRADNPEIVDAFMRFHHYIDTRDGKDLTVSLPKGDLSTFNPKTDRILAYTNDRVLELNSMIEDEGIEIIINGLEAIIIDDGDYPIIYPSCISKGRLMDEDKLELAMAKTERDIIKFGTEIPYKIISVEVDGEKYNIHCNRNHHKKQKVLKAELEIAQQFVVDKYNIPKGELTKWCQDNRGAIGVKERGWAWSRYLAHQNLVWDVRRPFATTVHKAQGREFSTVFIDQEDIKKSIKNNYYETYARLMYVALSRAINKVIIIN